MEKKLSYMEPNGLWKVSTEADCEGRSTRDLGIYRGNWYEIALHLADRSGYSLTFEKIDETKFTLPKTFTRDKVDVGFRDCVGTDFKAMLKDVPKYVSDSGFEFERGRWDGHITVCRPRTDEEKTAAIKARAMDKIAQVLSKEEREALGLD